MGCATNKVANDLVIYVNQGLLQIEELERKSLVEYAGVTGANFNNEQEVYETLKIKVIPIYERFFNELRDIHPSEKEVKMVHGQYIRAVEKILNGFKMKMKGIENKDERMIIGANKTIEQGNAEIQQWRDDFTALCTKYGVGQGKKK